MTESDEGFETRAGTISFDDFMALTVAGIEARDHKAVAISTSNWTRDFPPVCDAMAAEGYMFVCSPAADEQGIHMAYFVRPPKPEPGYRI
jgi:hypothetical protein